LRANRCRSVYSRGRGAASCRDFAKECDDLAFKRTNITLDLLERSRRFVAIEVPVERDLVADLDLLAVDPGVGDMWQDLAAEVILDALLQRHDLGVAQFGVWLGLAVAVAADLGVLIPLAERILDRFEFGRGKACTASVVRRTQIGEKGIAILVQLFAIG